MNRKLNLAETQLMEEIADSIDPSKLDGEEFEAYLSGLEEYEAQRFVDSVENGLEEQRQQRAS